jgi:hypothetical protein
MMVEMNKDDDDDDDVNWNVHVADLKAGLVTSKILS